VEVGTATVAMANRLHGLDFPSLFDKAIVAEEAGSNGPVDATALERGLELIEGVNAVSNGGNGGHGLLSSGGYLES